MKVSKLIEELQKCNPDDECEIYIHESHEVCATDSYGYAYVALPATEYVLCEIKVVEDNGWDGLITLEIDRVVGG